MGVMSGDFTGFGLRVFFGQDNGNYEYAIF